VASKLKRSATTASNPRPRVTSTKTDDKKVEVSSILINDKKISKYYEKYLLKLSPN
jgi:hypothetical protein